ncbi:hypothetical protein DENSPDRAFT_527573 [Dentipellis sp. KUC8613]|nr:hypothetical protein DENSPDRAFT_527573 [Dentipellis sp. KUC8613]
MLSSQEGRRLLDVSPRRQNGSKVASIGQLVPRAFRIRYRPGRLARAINSMPAAQRNTARRPLRNAPSSPAVHPSSPYSVASSPSHISTAAIPWRARAIYVTVRVRSSGTRSSGQDADVSRLSVRRLEGRAAHASPSTLFVIHVAPCPRTGVFRRRALAAAPL